MLRTRHREEVLLRACLEVGQRLVVDKVNPTAEQRARYVSPAKASGFRVVGYYFQSQVSECLRRNESRPPEERVPVKAILGTYKQLQVPRLEEGFDELHYVKIAGGAFVVESWQDEVRRA